MTGALSACNPIDANQARLCRMTLPALEGSGTQIEAGPPRRGPDPHSIRIDYGARRDERPARRHFVTCRFAAEGAGTELTGLATDRGSIAGATLYLLRRYYLDTPEGSAGDPGPGHGLLDVPEMPPAGAYLLEQVLVGLPRTAIYALLACAYALVYGLVGRINLAFGEIAAIGAAAAGLGVASFLTGGLTAPLPGLVVAIGLASGTAALHSTVAGHIAFALIPARRSQASLIATVGLSLALMEYLRLAGGTVPAWVPPFGASPVPVARAGGFIVTLTPVALLTSAIAGLAAAGLVATMRITSFGRAWRAQADDSVAASLFGIDGGRLLAVTLAIAGGLAGLAGALVAIQFGALGFADGFQLGLKALLAAVLGGIGSVHGALLGGLAVGAVETLWSAYLPIEGRDIALYALLVMTIVVRPDGFFGSGRLLQARV